MSIDRSSYVPKGDKGFAPKLNGAGPETRAGNKALPQRGTPPQKTANKLKRGVWAAVLGPWQKLLSGGKPQMPPPVMPHLTLPQSALVRGAENHAIPLVQEGKDLPKITGEGKQDAKMIWRNSPEREFFALDGGKNTAALPGILPEGRKAEGFLAKLGLEKEKNIIRQKIQDFGPLGFLMVIWYDPERRRPASLWASLIVNALLILGIWLFLKLS